MARPFKQRESYLSDAAFLNRCAQAVENDNRRPLKWKQEVINHLKAASILMLNAPEVETEAKPKGDTTDGHKTRS
jgi:hypothetical protein